VKTLIKFDRLNELEARCSLGSKTSYLKTLYDLGVNTGEPYEEMMKKDSIRAHKR
jgi:hypothetical protein